ncbi:nitroreductase family protein [Brooklawnia cerclae]|uniref:Nitroreductase domain-containing protein n=1 Tax=Brooklawnia cerclae TaxID=349934 RepID=A0ABX0SJ38_9ACTN|nr:hypothetical protein [Brooklawnia cerclae]NIH57929.1 hypothetical protein [Brooklawnia cerclae]
MNRKVIKVALIVVAILVGICLLAVSALMAISGAWTRRTYLEPWGRDYASSHADPRVRLVATGLLAASNHNMQPWLIRLDEDDASSFLLYADSSRMTPQVDPEARQLMISQGTFLEYVAVAGEHEGWDVRIDLFPDGQYDEDHLAESMNETPVARVTLSAAEAHDAPLFDATFLPDTNRAAYEPQALSPEQVATLEALPEQDDEGTVSVLQDDTDVRTIGQYAMRAATIEAGVARVMDEGNAIFRANERQKNLYRYGYSVEGQGTTGLMKHILQGLLTLRPSLNTGPAASENFIRSTQTSVDATPAYAMIVTDDNSRRAQVESGMLYSRLVLTGHTLGLAMQPLSQVLEEYPEMRVPHDEFQALYAPDGGTVQMVFRVGQPTENVPVSMRRDVMDLIEG